MTPQEFLDEFGTLAESAQGVPKLRELILELAVSGKLVEQDEDDEPVSGILKQIAADYPATKKKRPDVVVEQLPGLPTLTTFAAAQTGTDSSDAPLRVARALHSRQRIHAVLRSYHRSQAISRSN